MISSKVMIRRTARNKNVPFQRGGFFASCSGAEIPFLLKFPFTMSGRPPNKRRRTTAIGPDSAIFAKATTHKTITTTNRSGMVVQKDILVPLVPVKDHLHETTSSSNDRVAPPSEIINENDYGNTDGNFYADMDNGSSNRNKSKVSHLHRISFLQILQRSEKLLDATRLPTAICQSSPRIAAGHIETRKSTG
jgi:hypothetical protein